MSTLHSTIAAIQFNRVRTLATLDRVEKEPNPQRALGWRPGPGRAHVAWQLMHVAITEELFATERLVPGAKPACADLVPRFRGGSTPDDEIPSAAQIRRDPGRIARAPAGDAGPLRRQGPGDDSRGAQGAQADAGGRAAHPVVARGPPPGAGAHHAEPAEGGGGMTPTIRSETRS